MKLSKLQMNFCPACNNLMYPYEEKVKKMLIYQCRNCGRKLKDRIDCIYTNEIMKSSTNEIEIEKIPKDVLLDKALLIDDTIKCIECGVSGCAMIRAHDLTGESSLRPVWICRQNSCLRYAPEDRNRFIGPFIWKD